MNLRFSIILFSFLVLISCQKEEDELGKSDPLQQFEVVYEFEDTDPFFEKIVFFNESHGVMRADGQVHETFNGGITWEPCLNCAGISRENFINMNEGIFWGWVPRIIGSSPAVFRTVNGGITWDTIFNYPLSARDPFLAYPSRNTMVISGSTTTYFSKDQGSTWDSSSVIPASEYMSPYYDKKIDMIDETYGFLVSGSRKNKMYKTTDGAVTWQKMNPKNDPVYISLDFFHKSNGMALFNGIPHFSVDGGESWTKSEFDPEGGYAIKTSNVNSRVCFMSTYENLENALELGKLYIDGHINIHRSIDGGESFQEIEIYRFRNGKYYAFDGKTLNMISQDIGFIFGYEFDPNDENWNIKAVLLRTSSAWGSSNFHKRLIE